jgi:hypothetical protein
MFSRANSGFGFDLDLFNDICLIEPNAVVGRGCGRDVTHAATSHTSMGSIRGMLFPDAE